MISVFHNHGVKLILGTDAGGAPYTIHGFSLHEELEYLVYCGLSPYEALLTGTVNSAECLGELQELGTITTGKIADMVLLSGILAIADNSG